MMGMMPMMRPPGMMPAMIPPGVAMPPFCPPSSQVTHKLAIISVLLCYTLSGKSGPLNKLL